VTASLRIKIKPDANDIIAALDAAKTSAELVELLARLRLPDDADDYERGRVCSALIAVATRCWRRRAS
jgi:hypothetical protein